MKQILKFVWLACVLILVTAAPSLADEEEEVKDENSVNCISTSRIRSTKVVDDSSILFYTRGRAVYHNILPRRCNGLAREGRFSYRVSNSNLCRMDTIRLLYNGGWGLEEGRGCALGYFHEVTEEDLELILDKEPSPPQAQPLPPAEPEDVSKETDES
jgi:hypothetical protein